MKQIECSIGICVYNEGKNIKKLLTSISNQKLKKVIIDEIIIVSSGSTDNTLKIIKSFAKINKKIKIYIQKERKGKASAVNYFIQKSKNDILVLVGGDLLLTEHVVERLVRKFIHPNIGLTGGRPVPVNNVNDGVCGFAAHFLWDLHHRVSLMRPKMGEAIAFRKTFKRISPFLGADEALIEPIILAQGYKIKYIPEAIIFNKSPTTIKELIKQRKRNYWLHLSVKKEQYYKVSTIDIYLTLFALLSNIHTNISVRHVVYTTYVLMLEFYCRIVGTFEYYFKKNKRYTIWDSIKTTKNLIIKSH